jgi:DNA-binding NarL/FixJ family response regulator
MRRSSVTVVEPRVAIVGGAGALASEALTWTLTRRGTRVVGAYQDCAELEVGLRVRGASLHAAIVDADDPAAGPAAVAAIRQAQPEVKILLLCKVASPAVVRYAIDEQLEGVVLQSDGVEEVILALRHVLDGRAVMPAGWHPASLEPGVRLAALSAREREVLHLAASGMSNKEIASRLVISSNTVKFHLRRIYARLGVQNRVQATQAALESQATIGIGLPGALLPGAVARELDVC